MDVDMDVGDIIKMMEDIKLDNKKRKREMDEGFENIYKRLDQKESVFSTIDAAQQELFQRQQIIIDLQDRVLRLEQEVL
jgi:hypothetical protein